MVVDPGFPREASTPKGRGAQTYHYRPQRSWAKVMFLQASVILSTGGCTWSGPGGCTWSGRGGVPGLVLGGCTWSGPRGVYLTGTWSGGCVPGPGREYLVLGGVPSPRGVYLVRGVPGPGGCTWSLGVYLVWGLHPPDQVHPPGPGTPRTRYTPLGLGTPPRTRYSPQTRYTPKDQVRPPDQVHHPPPRIWPTSGRYASYWNAFCLKLKKIGPRGHIPGIPFISAIVKGGH